MIPTEQKAKEILESLFEYIYRTGYSVHFHKDGNTWHPQVMLSITETDPLDGRGTRGVTHHHIDGGDKFIPQLHRVVNKLGD